MYQTVIDYFNLASMANNPNPPRSIYFNATRTSITEGYEPVDGWILQKLDAERSVVISILAMPGRNLKPHIFDTLDSVYHEFEKRKLPVGFLVTK